MLARASRIFRSCGGTWQRVQIRRWFASKEPTKDYYKILEVSPTASDEDIKTAFKKLTKQHHPDVNEGKTSERYKEVLDAYHVLSNAQRKSEYDGIANSTAPGSSNKPRPQPDDPLSKWMREKYQQASGHPTDSDGSSNTNPRSGNQARQKKQAEADYSDDASTGFRVMEGLLVVSLFVGIAMYVHRVRQLKLERSGGKFSQEEEDEYVEAVMTKQVRLSELDCKHLSFDELEMLDRSSNYVLPLEYKKLVQDYRKMYKIPSPQEQADDLRQDQAERRLKKQAQDEVNRKVLSARKEEYDANSFPDFNYKQKFESSSTDGSDKKGPA